LCKQTFKLLSTDFLNDLSELTKLDLCAVVVGWLAVAVAALDAAILLLVRVDGHLQLLSHLLLE
jgi:hypothetical protein